MDAKRIIIFVVLLILLALAGNRACKYWRMYHPKPQVPTQPAQPSPTPAQ